MTLTVGFNATATWGSRQETARQLADRWIDLIGKLQVIDPIIAKWYDWPRDGFPMLPFVSKEAKVTKSIEAGARTNDDGSPQPLYGYQYSVYNTEKSDRRRAFTAHMFAGASGPFSFNNARVHTDQLIEPDPDLVTYDIFKGIVCALADAFDPDEVIAYPSAVLDFWPNGEGGRPIIKLAWLTYVAPRYAPLITPPSSAIVERRPDGGLFMAATDETFDVTNPAHMAVAQDIYAAAAPFNAKTKEESDRIIAEWRAQRPASFS